VARFEAPEGWRGDGRAKDFRPFRPVESSLRRVGLSFEDFGRASPSHVLGRSLRYHWGYSGPRLPYRLPELLDAIATGLPVYVVEGEKDVETGYAAAAGAAFTCNPGGVEGWKPEQRFARWFQGAHTVTIVADRDPNGAGRRWARAVRNDLARIVPDVRVVQARIETPGADLTDHLHAGFTLDELEPITP
jgi:hypothetical protein